MESFDKMKIDFSGKMNTINLFIFELFSMAEVSVFLEMWNSTV